MLRFGVDTDTTSPQRTKTRQFGVDRGRKGEAVAPRRSRSGSKEGRRVSQHRVTPESRAPSWWSSASRGLGPDRTSGRSLKQAPCSRRSCKEETEAEIGRQARLTRPLLGGCIQTPAHGVSLETSGVTSRTDCRAELSQRVGSRRLQETIGPRLKVRFTLCLMVGVPSD